MRYGRGLGKPIEMLAGSPRHEGDPAMAEVVTVLTYKGVDTLVADGGTQSWEASRKRLRRCSHVVCVRHQQGPYSAEGSEPHKAAFLVGKILDVVDSTETTDRQKILFSEYALVAAPNMPLHSANPVQYFDGLNALGIGADALEWLPVEHGPAPTPVEAAAPAEIADIKALLASRFGVTAAAIEITIRM